ncbi:MAG: TRAM domain-containing protein [Clostridia bacterium]|nr:TRAM domain-containing protein [Clostridia bacterium]
MRRVLRFIFTLIGAALGCGLVALVVSNVRFPGYSYPMKYTTVTSVLNGLYIAFGIGFGTLFYLSAPNIFDWVSGKRQKLENWLHDAPALSILFGTLGLLLGLLLAFLISLVIRTINVPVVPEILSIILYVLLGYLGCRFGITRKEDILSGGKSSKGSRARAKVLDTSVIIDGRIYDICKTGFLEGDLIVPEFVLKELRHIADSSDPIKRNRGRRGLDIIKHMRETAAGQVIISETDYEDIEEVDLKLLKLAQESDGILVTNDYNLNKVATVQEVDVLNINDLANAVKPILLPGEEISLAIVKEGKENGQGIGYLEDGTMVIVDGGKQCIGEERKITITSALQTSAGRMVFAKLDPELPSADKST